MFNSYTWHVRLGHLSDEVVKQFLCLKYPEVKINWKPFFCKQCAKSKSLKKKTLGMETQVPQEKPLNFWVLDFIGPLNLDINGCRYLVTVRDHATTYTFCAPMANRSEVPAKIVTWIKHLKTVIGKAPSYLRCNNALEYTKSLKPQLEAIGTTLAPVTPYSPSQNGEAERVNRTLGDMARTMLHASELSSIWWSFAYSTAAHIHNRLPNSRTGDKSPLELLYNVKLLPTSLYPFGARGIIHIPKEKRKKLDERAREGKLLGYPTSGSGWIFWVPSEKQMVHSASVKFPSFQKLPVEKSSPQPAPDLIAPVDKTESRVDLILKQIMLRLGEEKTSEIAGEEQRQMGLLSTAEEHNLPKTIKQALSGPDADLWRAAAEYEMLKFDQVEVWIPTNAPKGCRALGARWVFSICQGASLQ